MSKKEKIFSIEQFFSALADRTRLRLLNLMGDDEVCVCFFVEVLDMNQSKVSRHLAYLRKAGIVAVRRQGKWMHYRIVTPQDRLAAQILQELRLWLSQDKEMRRDRKRLTEVCCAPQPPIQLLGAPRPASLVSA
jgi:ArsR family transcriptional regulator